MDNKWKRELKDKTFTPAQAAKLVHSGDTVYVGTCSSIAYALCDALGDRGGELEDVTLTCSQIIRPVTLLDGRYPGSFKLCTYFMGAQERAARAAGLPCDFTSVNLSQVDQFLLHTAPADVAFFEVSMPDENGYMSFGASGVALNTYVRQTARTILIQINRNAPYVFGEENVIHVSQVDGVVFADQELCENKSLGVDDTIQTISDYLLEQIPDGACLQLGLGGVANAVGYGLKQKNDLGAHTELMTDSLMELMKSGNLNNSQKRFMPGKSVSAFAFGSQELYRFIDKNPKLYFAPFPIVNNVLNIAQNDHMISVNTALSIDLMGQVVADSLSGKQYSGTGGQLDFVRGAQLSKGGKSFIAIQSTGMSKTAGRFSRIVARLPEGSVVTTPRSEVQYVVTEYGCVNLKHLSMKNRIRAMIDLAHPDFRPQLIEDAKMFGLT